MYRQRVTGMIDVPRPEFLVYTTSEECIISRINK